MYSTGGAGAESVTMPDQAMARVKLVKRVGIHRWNHLCVVLEDENQWCVRGHSHCTAQRIIFTLALLFLWELPLFSEVVISSYVPFVPNRSDR